MFNGAQFIDVCLQSIAAQSFRDFELVICDNASTDATSEIAQAWCSRDSRFRYHRARVNRGAARNFNWAFELARGELFKWCAVDDLLAPEFLGQCVEALDRDGDAILAYTGTLDIDEGGRVIGEIYDNDSPLRFSDVDVCHRFHDLVLDDHSCIYVFGLIRRSALSCSSLIGPYPGSDRALLAELGLRGRFIRIEDNLMLHREHKGRSVNQYTRLRDRETWFSGKQKRLSFPHFRLFSEYCRAVVSAPLALNTQARCIPTLVRWLRWGGWRGMARDVTQNFG